VGCVKRRAPEGLRHVGVGITWPSTTRRAEKSAKRVSALMDSLPRAALHRTEVDHPGQDAGLWPPVSKPPSAVPPAADNPAQLSLSPDHFVAALQKAIAVETRRQVEAARAAADEPIGGQPASRDRP
jgi:hypothetical protein